MTNKLDDKVIIDRELLESLSHSLMEIQGPRRDAINAALAADLTGWAAVVVEPTLDQVYASYEAYDEEDSEEIYKLMLAASPPLPGGGE